MSFVWLWVLACNYLSGHVIYGQDFILFIISAIQLILLISGFNNIKALSLKKINKIYFYKSILLIYKIIIMLSVSMYFILKSDINIYLILPVFIFVLLIIFFRMCEFNLLEDEYNYYLKNIIVKNQLREKRRRNELLLLGNFIEALMVSGVISTLAQILTNSDSVLITMGIYVFFLFLIGRPICLKIFDYFFNSYIVINARCINVKETQHNSPDQNYYFCNKEYNLYYALVTSPNLWRIGDNVTIIVGSVSNNIVDVY
ncbi:hypothetical protein [Clostridium mediterraneense]|uniref:hypothetical protein n=1 Tax=Clostridium mediterraneense TaxID=1805472 RepID=UPI001A9A437A|nr:hypothetical protein [Clostridium mediterraneense]